MLTQRMLRPVKWQKMDYTYLFWVIQIPPWRGDPDLIPYGGNHEIMDILLSTSSELAELQETKEVTNSTFEVNFISSDIGLQ